MSSRNPQGIHRLSAAAVRCIARPGWHGDGGGLYLEVDLNGRKRWAMRLTVNGKRRDFGLGPLHKVSLLEARDRAAEYRSKAYRNIDPTVGNRPAVTVLDEAPAAKPSFEQVAHSVHKQRRAAWSNGKHVDQWINSLRDYAFPLIGAKPVDKIATPDVLTVLTPIWSTKPETARRVKQRIATVLDWARCAGLRSGDNPVDLIGDALAKHKSAPEHHAALPYPDVSAFIGKLRLGASEPMTKLAFEFLILTAARTTEVRKGLRAEIDYAAQTWTIPGCNEDADRRMKSGREHIVPLSTRAIDILKAAKKLYPNSDLIFPDTQTGRAMSENRFLVARDTLGYKEACTPHGFRSSFRDWAAEETTFQNEVVEMALAHAIKDKTEAAYRRGKLLAKRRQLMEAWARYVVPIR